MARQVTGAKLGIRQRQMLDYLHRNDGRWPHPRLHYGQRRLLEALQQRGLVTHDLDTGEWTVVYPPLEDWLDTGYRAGYCGPPVCSTHDGTPSTEAEDNDFMDGGDPCLHVLRLYRDPGEKIAVEANHSPSVWRHTNQQRTP